MGSATRMSFVLLAFTFLLNRLSPPTELTEPDEESTEASTAMEQPAPQPDSAAIGHWSRFSWLPTKGGGGGLQTPSKELLRLCDGMDLARGKCFKVKKRQLVRSIF